MTRRSLTMLALCVAGAVASGCGSDDEQGAPIPADAAAALQTRLDEVERRLAFGRGACADIQDDSKPAIQEIVNSLPSDVDEDIRAALEDGLDRLFELSEDQCEDEPEEEPSTETETVETEPEPTTTETTPTETETTPTETTEEPDGKLPPGQDGELPPGQDGDTGQGNGGGAIVPEAEE